MRRPTDPRSPVQGVRDPSGMLVLGLAIALGLYAAAQYRDTLIDWYDGEYQTRHEGPQRAKANLIAIFSADDYPSEAIRNDEQGTVAYQLQDDRRGRVSECRIKTSSGSQALDDATCRIIENRARFEPARDRAGKRIADEYSGRISWELPEA